MLNHVRSWLYVGDESRPFEVLDGLQGLYGLRYDSATACRLPLYLCSYKLGGFVIDPLQVGVFNAVGGHYIPSHQDVPTTRFATTQPSRVSVLRVEFVT